MHFALRDIDSVRVQRYEAARTTGLGVGLLLAGLLVLFLVALHGVAAGFS